MGPDQYKWIRNGSNFVPIGPNGSLLAQILNNLKWSKLFQKFQIVLKVIFLVTLAGDNSDVTLVYDDDGSLHRRDRPPDPLSRGAQQPGEEHQLL